jgi:hypothetical protein
MGKVIVKDSFELERIARDLTTPLMIHDYESSLNGDIESIGFVGINQNLKNGDYWYKKAETIPLSQEEIFQLAIDGAVFLGANKTFAWTGKMMRSGDYLYFDGDWLSYENFINTYKHYRLNGKTLPLTKEI